MLLNLSIDPHSLLKDNFRKVMPLQLFVYISDIEFKKGMKSLLIAFYICPGINPCIWCNLYRKESHFSLLGPYSLDLGKIILSIHLKDGCSPMKTKIPSTRWESYILFYFILRKLYFKTNCLCWLPLWVYLPLMISVNFQAEILVWSRVYSGHVMEEYLGVKVVYHKP